MRDRSIVIFAPQFRSTGIAPAMFSLGESIAKLGTTVTLLASIREWRGQDPRSGKAKLRIHAFRIGRLLRLLPAEGWYRFRISNLVAALLLTLSLTYFLIRHRPDAVIVGMQPLVAVTARVLSRSHTKVIISVQGAPRPGRLRKILWKALWKKSSLITCESRDIATQLAEILEVDSSTLNVVYNPHYDSRIHELSQARVELPEGVENANFTAVAVGRLTRQKGYDVLIEAIRILVERVDTRLLILGEGEDRQALVSRVRELGIEDRVVFLGQVDNPYPVIASADVFISGSRWEGLVRSPIEAQALGVPVVITNIDGGAREIVMDGEAGILVRPNDPETMSDAIAGLLGDDGLRERITANALDQISRFSPDVAALAYASLVWDEYSVTRSS